MARAPLPRQPSRKRPVPRRAPLSYPLRLLLVLLASGAPLFLVLAIFLFVPPSRSHEAIDFYVSRGESLSSVLRRLEAQGLIYDDRVLSLWARLWSTDRKIHWGHYRFESPMAPRRIINQMVLGTGAFRRVTVPEGLTLAEIAELMEDSGLGSREKLLKEAQSPELLSRAGIAAKGLEGYLFPTTYYFTSSTTEREILLAMVDQFKRSFTPAMREQSEKLGWDIHQAVTLASMIEKETALPSERLLISAVFHNRLEQKIALQSDPTVIYGLKRVSKNLTRRDLQHPSPYNTYLIPGLPPGPICNPGLAALEAALTPADVPYLYFVSKNDGSHLFSKTISEHNRAVDRYQKEKGSPKL